MHWNRLLILSAVTLFLAATGLIQAQESKSEGTTPKVTEKKPKRALPEMQLGSGLVAVRDAQSGKLRSASPEEMRRLLGGAGRSDAAEPKASLGPKGTQRVVVAPTHLKALAAKRSSDGKLVYGHVASESELETFAESPAKEAAHDR